MKRLPVAKPKQVLRALERAGFYIHHVTGSHYYLKHPARPEPRISLPFHTGDLKPGTLRSIVSQAGLTVENFRKLL